MTVDDINKAIQELPDIEKENISDGYHTFLDLYAHRIMLFLSLINQLQELKWVEGGHDYEIWRSKKHSDGSSIDGWFIVGIGKEPGQQITYHLPDRIWQHTSSIEELERAPEWDGHTPEDVLTRLRKL